MVAARSIAMIATVVVWKNAMIAMVQEKKNAHGAGVKVVRSALIAMEQAEKNVRIVMEKAMMSVPGVGVEVLILGGNYAHTVMERAM
jgi:hypothetical protein